MTLAVLLQDDAAYKVVYLLHIATMVAAFSGAMLAARLGAVGRQDPGAGRSIGAMTAQLTVAMHLPALALSGLFGVALIVMSDDAYEMSQTWISLAFLLWFALLGVMWFLLRPAQAAAAAGDADAARKVGMFTGIIHLLFLLMLIDMIWKPGAF